MKKVSIIIFLICWVISAHSQTDSLFLKNYEQKILEISKLKNDLQIVKENLTVLREVYKKDTIALQKRIVDLRKEVSSEKQKVLDLDKNKIKDERDNLQLKVDSLYTIISTLKQTIKEKENEISSEKANAKIKADKAKIEGNAEALASIINSYQNRQFDDIIKLSTKESVVRDHYLLGNEAVTESVLNDLNIYFNVREILSQKFAASQIKKAQAQLIQIKRQSPLLDALKENVDNYQDFNTALKETIFKIEDLDKLTSAHGDSEIQKLKFNRIVAILTDYMYNYYDYANYHYLSDIVLEIIKRKQLDADAVISDLQELL